MVGASLSGLVLASIFCGFYDGAERTVVAPKTETCKVPGADDLQTRELEVVVTSQIGEGCHHTATSSRFQGSLAYPVGHIEFGNFSNGSHNMDMQILQRPTEAGGVSLHELWETLEAGTGGTYSKIKESQGQKEVKRESISEESKFEKWEGGVRNDRGRGTGPIWGSSSVGDFVPTSKASFDSRKFRGGVEGRRNHANTPRAEVTCSPRSRSRIGTHPLAGTEEGDEGASRASRVPATRIGTAGQRKSVVARALKSIDEVAKATRWPGQSHQGNGCKLENVFRKGSSKVCRPSRDVSAIQSRTFAGVHEEEPGSARGQVGSSTSIVDAPGKTRCRNTDRGSDRRGRSDRRSSAGRCIHDARYGNGRDGGNERAGEEGCIGPFSDHSQTYFTYEGSCQSSQTERAGEEVNDPWNWSCDIWRRFSCGMREDAIHRSVQCKDDEIDRKACWNGEIPCPSDLWCIDPGRQLNGPQTAIDLREVLDDANNFPGKFVPGRVKGTKRVSFDDQVQIIPIEARDAEISRHEFEASSPMRSDTDTRYLTGESDSRDPEFDGFGALQFWLDFEEAWKPVLNPQKHRSSRLKDDEDGHDNFHPGEGDTTGAGDVGRAGGNNGVHCVWPPSSYMHRCHLHSAALVIRRGEEVVHVFQGDAPGTCKKTEVVCHKPAWFQELMVWLEVKGAGISAEVVLVTEVVKPVGVVDIVVANNGILKAHRTKCNRACSELIGELYDGLCSAILINGIEHSLSCDVQLNDADIIEICQHQNPTHDDAGPPAVSGKNDGPPADSGKIPIRHVVLPVSETVGTHNDLNDFSANVSGPPAVTGKEQVRPSFYITTVFVEDEVSAGNRCDVATYGTWIQHQTKVKDDMGGFRLVPVNWSCCLNAQHDVWLARLDDDGGSSVLAIYNGDNLFADSRHVRVCGKLSQATIDVMCQGRPWEWVIYNGVLLAAFDIINAVFEVHDGDVVCCGTCPQQLATKAGFLSATDDAPCPSDRWCADSDAARDLVNGFDNWGGDAIAFAHGASPIHDFISDQSCGGDMPPAHNGQESRLAKKVTINLCACIDDGPGYDAKYGFPLFQAQSWVEDLQKPWTSQLRQLPEGLVLHPSTAKALWHDQPVHQLCDKNYFLYVDGSAAKGQAGWAIAVVVSGVLECGKPATHLAGTMWGKVTTDEGHPAWLGAKVGDSIEAEIQAATIATLFFLAHVEKFQDGPVFLCPDLIYSEGLINGVFSPHQMRTGTEVLSQLGSIATDRGLGLIHAKAHQGWEWNELVDTLAKYATSLDKAEIPKDVTFVAQMAKNHEGRRWMEWSLDVKGMPVSKTLPPTIDGCCFDVRPPETRDCPELETVMNQTPWIQQAVQIKAMTLNALSLRATRSANPEIGRAFEMKTERIDAQAMKDAVDFICARSTYRSWPTNVHQL